MQYNTFTDKGLITKLAFLTTLFFIFSIPWGNALWDGLTKVIGFIAFGLVGLSVITSGFKSTFSLFHFFIALFVAWQIISLSWSPDLINGEYFLSSTVQLIIIAFLITLIIENREDLLLSYQSYLLGNLVGSGIIIYNYLNGIESLYYQRYAIPVLDIDGQSIMLALALPIAAYLATQTTNKLIKLFYTTAIPTVLFAIFLTGTRTAAIIAIIGIFYWLFTYRKSSPRVKIIFFIVFVCALAMAVYLAPEESIERILSSSQSISSGTLNNRTGIWTAAIEQWKSAPIAGHGIGSLTYVLSSLHVEYNGAHNTYIHLLTESGIIGLGIYLAIIAIIIIYILHTDLSEKAFLFSLLFMILVSQITQHTHFNKETWFALTMLALHAYSYSRPNTLIRDNRHT